MSTIRKLLLSAIFGLVAFSGFATTPTSSAAQPDANCRNACDILVINDKNKSKSACYSQCSADAPISSSN